MDLPDGSIRYIHQMGLSTGPIKWTYLMDPHPNDLSCCVSCPQAVNPYLPSQRPYWRYTYNRQ